MMDHKQHFECCVTPARLDRMNAVLTQRTHSLTIVLDRVRNHHNISAVIRSADAFGISTIHLVGEMFEYSKGITLGSQRWINIVSHQAPGDAIQTLQREDFQIVVMQPQELCKPGAVIRSIPVTQLPFEKKLALVFGNEVKGVDSVFLDAADLCSYIPMHGFVESLNISVACAICLFTARAAFQHTKQVVSTLSAEEQNKLRTAWLKNNTRIVEQNPNSDA